MPTDIIYSDDGADHLTYFSKANPEISRRVYRGNIVTAAFIAQVWHGGQWTALYSLGCGSFDYATIERAHAEGCKLLATFDGDMDDPAVNDAYYGLLGMVEDLASALDPRFGEGARCAQCATRDAREARSTCASCD